VGVWAVVLVAVFAVVLILGANLLLPVRFAFFATFSGTKFDYDAKVRLPLIPWYIAVPKLRAIRARQSSEERAGSARQGDGGTYGTGAAPMDERQGGETPSATATTPIRDRLRAIWRTTQAFRSHYREISSLVSYVARAVTVDELRLDVTVGLDEAAETALLAGALQSATSVGIGLLCRKGVRFSRRPRIRVVPAYNRLCLSGMVQVRVSVVPLRGIIALGRLRSHFIKAKSLSRSVVSNRAGWNTKA